ncbi:EXS-domain-containing protein [Terfezia boudieri ATCC MYA-4762]|uniref:EXS-domain-containing protein n=1 Tax=Terfezia boudieri ATCC MYA-4762 TaxID=1051890 RepID=A0A3N4L582_9PEZI|nr:EXS-domain-containing protein [Terfezia boudieri ATCC MYA-4762]
MLFIVHGILQWIGVGNSDVMDGQGGLLIVIGLLNPYATWPFLRQEMAFKRPIIYYIAMIVNSLLRFNWIFYIIYPLNSQQCSVSIIISLSEVFRRWIWAFLRMDNEHCTNVATFRAYREIALPYELPTQAQTFSLPPGHVEGTPHIQQPTSFSKLTVSPGEEPLGPSTTPSASGHHSSTSAATLTANSTSQKRPASTILRTQSNLEDQSTFAQGVRYPGRPASMIQCRESEVGTPTMRALNAMGSALARAHTQDFERRKSRPETERVNTDDEEEDDDDDDDDDDSSHASEDEVQVNEDTARRHLSNLTGYSIRSRGTGRGY